LSKNITIKPKPSNSADHYSKNGNVLSVRHRVFAQLNKNPLLTAKPLCKLLELPFSQYANYVGRLKNLWKHYHQNGLGLKCPISHRVRGWCFVSKLVDRAVAVDAGWVLSRSRNRMLVWRDGLGRMEWFETGRVNFILRSGSANMGRVKQLVCNGFSFTGLVSDNKLMMGVLDSIQFKGAHDVYATAQRLPYMRIDKYAESNGVVIKLGDRTHPHAVEVEFSYPDWMERSERALELSRKAIEENSILIQQFFEGVKEIMQPKPVSQQDVRRMIV